MTKIIQILVLISLFSCYKDNNRYNYRQTPNKDIDEIIDVIIKSDSIFPFNYLVNQYGFNLNKVKSLYDTIPVCKYLSNINLISKSGLRNPPPRPLYLEISINKLLDLKPQNKLFFNKVDSLDFVYQSDLQRVYEINNSYSKKLILTTLQEQLDLHEKKHKICFCNLTYPIFSFDNRKAYVELQFNCGLSCTGDDCYRFYMIKNGENWDIYSISR